MYNINDVAKYFLTKKSMTRKNLQQLVYYAYVWTLALLNIKLFNNRIEAWVHGPTIPDLYDMYKEYGWNNIPLTNEFNESIFTDEILNVFEAVFDTYGNMDIDDLEYILRRELPWVKARGNCAVYDICDTQISDKDIIEYYKKEYEEYNKCDDKNKKEDKAPLFLLWCLIFLNTIIVLITNLQ